MVVRLRDFAPQDDRPWQAGPSERLRIVSDVQSVDVLFCRSAEFQLEYAPTCA